MSAAPELVLVEWEDAADIDSDAWVDNEPIENSAPVIFQTVGFLLYMDMARLIITSSWSPSIVGMRTQIPLGMVRRMVNLKDDT